MKKTVQVVMLHYKNHQPNEIIFNHLYFTSDDELQKGDKMMMNGSIIREVKINALSKIVCTLNGTHSTAVCKKIVATTDESLGLPLIPESFVENYVKSNGQIKETAINCGKYGTPKVTLDTDEDFVIIGETLDEAVTAWVRAYCSLNYAEYNQGILQMKVKEAFINGANWQKQQN